MKKKIKAKSKARPEDQMQEKGIESVKAAGRIVEGLRKRKPSLADLDEWEETEPPFPTYGGPALEEQLKAMKKNKKPSPYL